MSAELDVLMKQAADLQSLMSTLVEKNGKKDDTPNADAIYKDTFEKMKTSILDEIEKRMEAKKAAELAKSIAPNKGEPAPAEPKMKLGEFLLKCKYNHPDVSSLFMKDTSVSKTVMNETTSAQGGYTVAPEYATQIIGELTNMATIVPKCTPFPHSLGPTKYVPKWLTDLSIFWVAEEGDKTLTKPTLTRKTSTLKKMAAIVPMTDEYLQDDFAGMEGLLAKRIARAMANEIERVGLIGTTVGGDAFNGILNETGTHTVAQAIANLSYLDLVNAWNHADMLEEYRIGAEWYMNRTLLAKLMLIVDGNNRPLWNMQNSINPPMAGTIFGAPVNISSQITNTCSTGANTSTIIYGNYQFILLGYKVGNEGIQVLASQHAVIGTAAGIGAITYNAFQNDETLYRFVMRKGILVSIPEAFVCITGAK